MGVYNRSMNDKQTKRLGKIMNPPGTPIQLAYVQAVMLVEFEQSINNDSERMRKEYGNCLFHYLESLLDES